MAAAARPPEHRPAVQIDQYACIIWLGIDRRYYVHRHAIELAMRNLHRITLFHALGAVGIDLVVELAARADA